MLTLSDSKELRDAFSQKALEATHSFTIETNLNRTLIMYQEVIKAFPGKIDEDAVQKKINECYVAESEL